MTADPLATFDATAARYIMALVILARAGEEPWLLEDQTFADALEQAATSEAVAAVVRAWFAWRTGSPVPAGGGMQ
jgi:hypothetical protein